MDLGNGKAISSQPAQKQKLKASIVAGVVMCNKCKCECDLEINAQGQKLDEELMQKEEKQIQEVVNLPKSSYGKFSIKTKPVHSIFSRLGGIKRDRKPSLPKRIGEQKVWKPKEPKVHIQLDPEVLKVKVRKDDKLDQKLNSA